ncbi:NAD-dependent epimerase/dehydratase family protein [Streptomyces sp. NBC_01538]|uniref:NAD-dependent epimerase/dehydratase family protein n=1 Tax=Streptomyces sp. NBC_01538 TaxID=2903897 RepID=UPI00386B4010
MDDVLITGAAGFIGSALTAALRAYGVHVTAVDDLSVPFWRPHPAGLQIRDVRTLTPQDLEGTDTVVHLAAHKSVPGSFRDQTFEHNTAADRHLLEVFTASSARRLLLATSCEVYGQHHGPLSEQTPLQPRSPYAAGKAATEHLSLVYRPLLGPEQQLTTLRFFNTFGPLEGSDAVVPAFLDAAAEGRPLVIEGDGSQARDLTHIDDTTTMLTNILQRRTLPPALNLGSGRTITVLELADTVIALTGRGTIRHTDPRPNEIDSFTADMSLYHRLYGPVPTGDLVQALADTRLGRDAARPQPATAAS